MSYLSARRCHRTNVQAHDRTRKNHNRAQQTLQADDGEFGRYNCYDDQGLAASESDALVRPRRFLPDHCEAGGSSHPGHGGGSGRNSGNDKCHVNQINDDEYGCGGNDGVGVFRTGIPLIYASHEQGNLTSTLRQSNKIILRLKAAFTG